MDESRWWAVYEWPFHDHGAVGVKKQLLFYIFGTKVAAEQMGLDAPAHDSWGHIEVQPLYLEDVQTELARQRSIRDEALVQIERLQTIQTAMLEKLRLGL